MAVALIVVGGVVTGARLICAAHSTGVGASNASGDLSSSIKKRQQNRKMKLELECSSIIYMPSST